MSTSASIAHRFCHFGRIGGHWVPLVSIVLCCLCPPPDYRLQMFGPHFVFWVVLYTAEHFDFPQSRKQQWSGVKHQEDQIFGNYCNTSFHTVLQTVILGHTWRSYQQRNPNSQYDDGFISCVTRAEHQEMKIFSQTETSGTKAMAIWRKKHRKRPQDTIWRRDIF